VKIKCKVCYNIYNMPDKVTNQTAEEKLQSIREGNRRRQKIYYAKHKQEILNRQKRDREELKECRKQHEEQTHEHHEHIDDYEPIVSQVVEKPPPPKTMTFMMPKNRKSKTQRIVYDLPTVLKMMEEYPHTSDATKNAHISRVKTIFRITGCDDLKTCLNDYKRMYDLFENAEVERGKGKYGVNTKKNYYDTILLMIDKFDPPLPVTKEANKEYHVQNSIYKQMADDEAVVKTTDPRYDITVPSINREQARQNAKQLYDSVPRHERAQSLQASKLESLKKT